MIRRHIDRHISPYLQNRRIDDQNFGYLCIMKWKAVEIILLVTRLLGVLLILYSTLCFALLEKYNLQGIGYDSAYTIYWGCLVACCLVFILDFLAQIFKLAHPEASWPSMVQTLLYASSFILVVLIIADYHFLVREGDRYDVIGVCSIEYQIQLIRESVIFDSLYIGGRSLFYSIMLVLKSKRKEKLGVS